MVETYSDGCSAGSRSNEAVVEVIGVAVGLGCTVGREETVGVAPFEAAEPFDAGMLAAPKGEGVASGDAPLHALTTTTTVQAASTATVRRRSSRDALMNAAYACDLRCHCGRETGARRANPRLRAEEEVEPLLDQRLLLVGRRPQLLGERLLGTLRDDQDALAR